MPSGSKMDLLLASAESISDGSNASGVTFKKEKSYGTDVIAVREERSENM